MMINNNYKSIKKMVTMIKTKKTTMIINNNCKNVRENNDHNQDGEGNNDYQQ